MKKIFYLFVSMLLIFSLSACSRARRNNIDTSLTEPTNTPLAAVEPTQVSSSSAAEVPTSTPVQAQLEPTAMLVPTESPDASAANDASAELEQTLAELEQLLNDMDTNVDVP
jgi:hypothetical protein